MNFPPFTLPKKALSVSVVTNGHREVSPYSFNQTAYNFLGGHWQATLDLNDARYQDRANILAWLTTLEGPTVVFHLLAMDYRGPHGVLTQNPTFAAAASQRGKTLVVQHAPGEAFVVTDQITINGHLHMINSVQAPDVSNQQEITIWPRLREDVAPGGAIEALAPYGSWALAKPSNGHSTNFKLGRSMKLDLIEAL